MSRPAKSLKFGQIEVAEWHNQGKYGIEKSYTFQKSYKSGDEWKHTSFFKQNELYKIKALIDELINEEIRGDAAQPKSPYKDPNVPQQQSIPDDEAYIPF